MGEGGAVGSNGKGPGAVEAGGTVVAWGADGGTRGPEVLLQHTQQRRCQYLRSRDGAWKQTRRKETGIAGDSGKTLGTEKARTGPTGGHSTLLFLN